MKKFIVNADHCVEADKFMIDILNCVEGGAFEALPIGKSKSNNEAKAKLMPGWFESVKPHRDTAYFWSGLA